MSPADGGGRQASPNPGVNGKNSCSSFPASRPSTCIRACSRTRSYDAAAPREGFHESGTAIAASAEVVIDALPLQFLDLQLRDPGDQRKMIVVPPPCVAPLLPSANFAMLPRVGTNLVNVYRMQCAYHSVANAPEIRAVVVHSIQLAARNRSRARPRSSLLALRLAPRRPNRRRGKAAAPCPLWFLGQASYR